MEARALRECGFWFDGLNVGREDEVEEHWVSLPPVLSAEASLEDRLRCAHLSALGSELLHAPPSGSDGAAAAMASMGVNERKRARHRAQREAIARQLGELGVLGRGCCIVELGAGNGELSRTLTETFPEAARTDALILLDHGRKPKGRSGGGRLSADAMLDGSWAHFQRVQASIEGVDLTLMRDRLAPGRPLVVLAKHLCGAATDYALRAVAAASTQPLPPVAVVLATCCHHRCDWVPYPSRGFLGGTAGIGEVSQFDALRRLSSRGVNAADDSERAADGRRAKDLLDEGRRRYLEAQGFDARLRTFVDAQITPENVMLVASRVSGGLLGAPYASSPDGSEDGCIGTNG